MLPLPAHLHSSSQVSRVPEDGAYSLYSSLQCPAASCLGLGRLLSDCQACLAFSSPTAPPRGPGALGWCVHNESCLPRPGEWQAAVGERLRRPHIDPPYPCPLRAGTLPRGADLRHCGLVGASTRLRHFPGGLCHPELPPWPAPAHLPAATQRLSA